MYGQGNVIKTAATADTTPATSNFDNGIEVVAGKAGQGGSLTRETVIALAGNRWLLKKALQEYFVVDPAGLISMFANLIKFFPDGSINTGPLVASGTNLGWPASFAGQPGSQFILGQLASVSPGDGWIDTSLIVPLNMDNVETALPLWTKLGVAEGLEGFATIGTNYMRYEWTETGITPPSWGTIDPDNTVCSIQLADGGGWLYNPNNTPAIIQPEWTNYVGMPVRAIFQWLRVLLPLITGDRPVAYTSPYSGGFAFQDILTPGDEGGRLGFGKDYAWGALNLPVPVPAGNNRIFLINIRQKHP